MPGLVSVRVQCPCCWEHIETLVDTSIPEQEYVEDCQVCCRPMVLTVTLADGDECPEVCVRPEND
ncbi:CPXCG motif-containing cysteine-rich protein [Alcanivorax profundi]|uniref:CPXCG motif-containing cysteine-rich protein n=1 Tax=Alcanivorax profundi TaxID=2338368 RepID=A0A418XTK7_9GAMM|nr:MULTISPECIES: CPXCG motif-containing cysteine-rich protein [Alcanivorax]RJG15982.1 CPXCG motif-containing cysteine-rich protein [Alcanivorax profundi]